MSNNANVAVLGLPHLATTLADAGLTVITGETLREAASAVATALKSGPVPVVLADAAAPMLNSWFTKVIASTPTVLVRVETGAAPITAPGALRLTAPVPVDDVLAALNLPAVVPGMVLDTGGAVAGGPYSGTMYDDRTVTDVDDGAGPDAVEDWFSDPDPAPAPVAAPALPAPITAAADDDWSDLGWGAPTSPDSPSTLAPAPALAPTTPVSPPATSAVDDDWSDLGWGGAEPADQPVPAETAPALPADAVPDPSLPPAFPEFSWETPTPAPTDSWGTDTETDSWGTDSWEEPTPAPASEPGTWDTPAAAVTDDWSFLDTVPDVPSTPPALPVPPPHLPVPEATPAAATFTFGAPAAPVPPRPAVVAPQPPTPQYTAPAAPRTPVAAPRPSQPRYTPPSMAPATPAQPTPAQPAPQAYQPPVLRPQAQAAPARVETIGVPQGFSPTHGELAKVICVVGAKGGVGKTSISSALAQHAAVLAGNRTVLVDGNRGQGDIRVYLGMARSGLPTLYDAAMDGNIAQVLLTPDRVAASRPAHMERLECALILAPPQEFASADIITADLYQQAIAYARTKADLVVIDSQIVEGAERGLFDDLFIPMMRSYAWTVGITDLSTAGVNNLMTNMAQFAAQGVPVDRMMTMLNRVPDATGYDEQSTASALNRFGRFVAAVPVIDAVHSGMAHGTAIHDNPTLAPVLDNILLAVTGNPAFAAAPSGPGRRTRATAPAQAATGPAAEDGGHRGGLFGRLRRR